MKQIKTCKLATSTILLTIVLCSCASLDNRHTPSTKAAHVDIKIIAFNDLHGNLEPPDLFIVAPSGAGAPSLRVPAGGAAYLASAIKYLKGLNPNHAVVSAGDLIGASPLVSALFLDEPTIEVVNQFEIDFNAVGNHEFDKGQYELLRMKNGGCAKHTVREPCMVDKSFQGANFEFLASNTVKADGTTLFPSFGIKAFGGIASKVRVGFIGMTLKDTPNVVTSAGVAGLRFKDEAETANALIPRLKAHGADVIVVILHQGGHTAGSYNDKSCPNLSGDILPILAKLDPAVDVVISGHTHSAYVCDYGKINTAKPFLLTSAGQYGTLVTDINLTIDTGTRKVLAKTADNLIVQGEPAVTPTGTIPLTPVFQRFTKDSSVDLLIKKYASAAQPLAQRVVATLTAPVTRKTVISGESALGNLIADAQLAATSDPAKGGAQIAFMNPGGVRADLTMSREDRSLTYLQLFSVQPFGNNLIVKSFTGLQLRALLEQQYDGGTKPLPSPRILFPSDGFTYAYDLTQPAGARVSHMHLHGKPVSDNARYRVAMNSFLASGGDHFSVFSQGSESVGGCLDIDALESYLKAHSPASPAKTNRITRID